MASILTSLEPKIIWSHFEEICQIPRPSKKEDKIRAFLIDFAKQHQLQAKTDNIGNVLICKPGTSGKENLKTLVLQSHMDMVCEKNSGTDHDFEADPIQPYIDGEWVKARGTTLGADDGIGIAAQLAILGSKEIAHGPLECLFTVDEESGLTGAFALEPDFFEGKILLNLDSEDEGEIFVGSAGGIDTIITMNIKPKPVPKDSVAYIINVSGLKGGHSGDDIHKGYGNAIKILNRLVWNISYYFKARLATFEGGNLRNAIPRESKAVITLNPKHKKKLKEYFADLSRDISNELAITEPDLVMTLKKTELPAEVLPGKSQLKLLNAIYACPHGVFSMSQRMPGMVETSTNLASVKFGKKNNIIITTSQRSDSNSAKLYIARMVESVFVLAGARVEHSDGYPGWTPNPDSEILGIGVKTYEDLFHQKPLVRSIHAGLECGLFLEKYPDLDMISFGPTLRGVHSPDEKINIKTVEKFWLFLLEVMKRIPAGE